MLLVRHMQGFWRCRTLLPFTWKMECLYDPRAYLKLIVQQVRQEPPPYVAIFP